MVSGNPLGENTYIISRSGGDTCIVVDPGAPASTIIQKVGMRSIAAVLLTHAHFDHILSLDAIRGDAPVYIHALDADGIADAYQNASLLMGMEMTARPADHLIRAEGKLHLADMDIEVLHTPGHTPGSVCFLLGKALFSGDTLFYHSYGRVDLPGGDAGQMRSSLLRLSGLEPSIQVYPGHGLATRIEWEQWM